MINFNNLVDLQVSNDLITIRRYRDEDFSQLEQIFDVDFFKWFFTNYSSCNEFVEEKMREYAKQNLVMYVIIDNKTNHVIGTSSLYEISLRHKRLEMGSSWLAKNYHGSQYNASAKYLLIDTLINVLGFNRIQWKTDALNEKSKTAMLKLGFTYEGTLFRHAITYTGRVRDSIIFSVTDESWKDISMIIQKRIKLKSTINS